VIIDFLSNALIGLFKFPIRCVAIGSLGEPETQTLMRRHYILTSAAALAGDLPDAHMMPGATNPNVTQANIQETVCMR
jgi:hypothetical protein